MLFERARGGGRDGGPERHSRGATEHMRMETWAAVRIDSRLRASGSSEKDRPLVDPCIPRPPPRCYDPDSLRSLSAAYFPEILKGGRGGASGHVSDEIR